MIQMASAGKRLQSEGITRVSITITSIQFNFAAINNSVNLGTINSLSNCGVIIRARN